MDLSEHLRSRGLNLDPVNIDEDPVLDNEGAVEAVAGVWEGNAHYIRLVIQARLNAIGKNLIYRAIPEEVPVLRQALVEVSAIINDFERYSEEHRRREAKKDNNTSAKTTAQDGL